MTLRRQFSCFCLFDPFVVELGSAIDPARSSLVTSEVPRMFFCFKTRDSRAFFAFSRDS